MVLRKIGALDRILSGKLDSCVPNCCLHNIYCIVQSFNKVSLLLNCALPFYTFQKLLLLLLFYSLLSYYNCVVTVNYRNTRGKGNYQLKAPLQLGMLTSSWMQMSPGGGMLTPLHHL